MTKTDEQTVIEIDADEMVYSVSAGTIARTVAFAITWLNALFAFIGAPTLDVDVEAVYQIVSAVAAFIASTVAYWKNNSFSTAALVGDAVKDMMKKETTVE